MLSGWKGLEHSTGKAGPGSESAGVDSIETVIVLRRVQERPNLR